MFRSASANIKKFHYCFDMPWRAADAVMSSVFASAACTIFSARFNEFRDKNSGKAQRETHGRNLWIYFEDHPIKCKFTRDRVVGPLPNGHEHGLKSGLSKPCIQVLILQVPAISGVTYGYPFIFGHAFMYGRFIYIWLIFLVNVGTVNIPYMDAMGPCINVPSIMNYSSLPPLGARSLPRRPNLGNLMCEEGFFCDFRYWEGATSNIYHGLPKPTFFGGFLW